MFNKVATLLRVVPRTTTVRNMSGGHGVPAHWKPIRQVCEENKSHMNFMPVPAGSWQEAYKAKTAKANMLLLASAGSVVATFVMLWCTGCIYFHGAPPSYLKNKK